MCPGASNSGRVPNLEWDAISMESLRELPGFAALPEVQELILQDTESYRQVVACIISLSILHMSCWSGCAASTGLPWGKFLLLTWCSRC